PILPGRDLSWMRIGWRAGFSAGSGWEGVRWSSTDNSLEVPPFEGGKGRHGGMSNDAVEALFPSLKGRDGLRRSYLSQSFGGQGPRDCLVFRLVHSRCVRR